MKAKIITLCNQKGGAGKTTNAINIASTIAMQAHRVLLVDIDEQRTALTWAACSEQEIFPTVSLSNSPNPAKQIQMLANDYDYIVIDTSPRLAQELASILRISDIAIISCKPSPADVWASDELVENIKMMRNLGHPIEARYLLCDVNLSSNYYKDIVLAITENDIGMLQTIVATRNIYKQLDSGMSVIHSDDEKACAEMSKVTAEIMGLINDKT